MVLINVWITLQTVQYVGMIDGLSCEAYLKKRHIKRSKLLYLHTKFNLGCWSMELKSLHLKTELTLRIQRVTKRGPSYLFSDCLPNLDKDVFKFFFGFV